jgi:hypothetical protein
MNEQKIKLTLTLLTDEALAATLREVADEAHTYNKDYVRLLMQEAARRIIDMRSVLDDLPEEDQS